MFSNFTQNIKQHIANGLSVFIGITCLTQYKVPLLYEIFIILIFWHPESFILFVIFGIITNFYKIPALSNCFLTRWFCVCVFYLTGFHFISIQHLSASSVISHTNENLKYISNGQCKKYIVHSWFPDWAQRFHSLPW